MTDKKQNALINALKGFFPYFATPAMLAFLIWYYATDRAENKVVQFSTPEMKVHTETYMKEKPSPADERMKIFMDSLNTAHAMQSRKKRDSIMNEILNRQKHQDSINLLNADQLYQIKEQLKGH